ncbi:MAG TPA: hypothetical protein PKJ17_03270 [Syntrophorhabdaceae bacterium]|nr:hypothetical protein [Syntrophorhabdaceae bacterium]
MGALLLCLAGLLLPAAVQPLRAAEHIVLSRAGAADDAMWNSLRKYLAGKGFTMSVYDSPASMEKQVEIANKANKERATFMLAVELVPSDSTDAFVAVSNAKKGKGLILNVDEVPGSHASRSGEMASSIAAAFQRKVKAIPLFMFLGIDMPGAFVRLEVQKARPADAFDKLHEGLLNYMKRGKDERERQGERRNTSS